MRGNLLLKSKILKQTLFTLIGIDKQLYHIGINQKNQSERSTEEEYPLAPTFFRTTNGEVANSFICYTNYLNLLKNKFLQVMLVLLDDLISSDYDSEQVTQLSRNSPQKWGGVSFGTDSIRYIFFNNDYIRRYYSFLKSLIFSDAIKSPGIINSQLIYKSI